MTNEDKGKRNSIFVNLISDISSLIEECFTHVLIYKSNQQLIDEYGSLFVDAKIKNEQIWKIDTVDRKLVLE